MDRLVVVGSGSQARYVIDICAATSACELVGLADLESADRVGLTVNGVPILWGFDQLLAEVDPVSCKVVVAYGRNDKKRDAVERLIHAGFSFASAISHLAAVSPWAEIDVGTVINPLAAVMPNARIGRHVVVHSQAVIEHDNVLEDYVNVAPGAVLAGNVTVGEAAYIYTGASIKPGVGIGPGAVVGAGAVVIDNVPPGVVVAGVPAVQIGLSGVHR